MKFTIEIPEDNLSVLVDQALLLFETLSRSLDCSLEDFERATPRYFAAQRLGRDVRFHLAMVETQLRDYERVAALLIPPMKALVAEVNTEVGPTASHTPLSTARLEEDLERSRAMMRKIHAEIAGETDVVG